MEALALPGYDGTEIYVRERDIPGTRRVQKMVIRCAPGTFEWRFARAVSGTHLEMLYLAGCEFNRLWERAGLDGPRSVDWDMGGGSGWGGMPDGRLMALDDVNRLTRALGKLVSARLVNYVVQGKTSREMAFIYGTTQRKMADILYADLQLAAGHLGFGFRTRRT